MLASNGESGPPCGTPCVVASTLALGQLHPGAQIGSDQTEHPLVRDAAGQQAHQPVELHGIEERFEVTVHRVVVSRLGCRLHAAHRLVGSLTQAKPIAVRAEVRVKERR